MNDTPKPSAAALPAPWLHILTEVTGIVLRPDDFSYFAISATRGSIYGVRKGMTYSEDTIVFIKDFATTADAEAFLKRLGDALAAVSP